MTLFRSLDQQSHKTIILQGAALILLIGGIDYVTGPELSFSIFYLIPIAMVAWLRPDTRVAISVAVTAAFVWLFIDLISDWPYSSDLIPYWNASVRLGFFLVVAFTLKSLRTAITRREEMAHFIVHDLRSPLANTLTGLQYLLETSDDTLDSTQQELVQLSVSSCNRMLTLVNSLLDLTQLESRQLQPNAQPTTVQTLFVNTLQQVKALALQGEVEIASQIELGAECVLSDRDLTERVLVNLVSNALRYSPHGTTVLMRARPIKDVVTISICDQGSGIPKEWTKKVFGKFSQVEARKEGIAVGSGLGLAFCRLAVEAQGGRIWITTTVDQGTTVTFTLPCPERPSTS